MNLKFGIVIETDFRTFNIVNFLNQNHPDGLKQESDPNQNNVIGIGSKFGYTIV